MAIDLHPREAKELHDIESAYFEAVEKLNKDLKNASKTITTSEARSLVDRYYQIQEFRKTIGNHEREGEPNMLNDWLFDQMKTLELSIKSALTLFAKEYRVGHWLLNIYGVGPIISSGVIAHFDVTAALSPSSFVKFAGLSPNQKKPTKGVKRDYNAKLKTLIAFHFGECIVRTANSEKSFYGPLFKMAKDKYWARNARGEYAQQAAAILNEKNFSKKTEAYRCLSGCYPLSMWEGYLELTLEQRRKRNTAQRLEPGEGTGCLPPSQIHARARRWIASMFALHVYEVMHWDVFKHAGRVPWILDPANDKSKGHTSYIAPPDFTPEGLRKLPGKSLAKSA